MKPAPNSRSLILIFSVGFFIVLATYFISLIARGYRFSLKDGFSLEPTGMISAVSRPKGASVYLDDKLITATDDTISLSPGVYQLKITKDGFLPWQKTVTVKPETVYQADIQLFSTVPNLKPVTLTGAINPAVNLDNTKIVYAVASASAAKDNGLYLIESAGLPLSLIRSDSRQIAVNTATIDWSDFSFTFSPNSRQILATNSLEKINYLLPLDTPISPQTLVDITHNLDTIHLDWQTQTTAILAAKLQSLPKDIQPFVATDSAQNLQFSSDDNKILYLAQTDGNIKANLITPPPARSTQTEHRQLLADNYYVYDLKDDTNFLIGPKNEVLYPSWIPNTNNLTFVNQDNLKVVDYDGTNRQVIFASNFNHRLVIPWTGGDKIIILTTPYPGAPENLYSISVK
ncbi:MAG TPA: PEGA domain-containing protein [Candidatus Woesebacteria bacterium]|nr:PEGA domain-containing protein [Candidatus Woesebacteria bacterium]